MLALISYKYNIVVAQQGAKTSFLNLKLAQNTLIQQKMNQKYL